MTVYDDIAFECGPVVPALSKCLRSSFVARPGHKLVGGDFSQIEARVNAWMADEQWLLEAYRNADLNPGRHTDMYRVAYAKSFNVSVEEVDGGAEKGPQRQIGKYQILSCGYQGSCGAWLRFDPTPTLVTKAIKEQFYGAEPWRKAAEQYDRTPNHLGLAADSWIAIKVVINSWREGHPNIVQSWWDRQDAAIEAVDAPGVVVPVLGGKVKYLVADGFLWAQMPSGKLLAYANPHLIEKREQWLVDADGEMVPADEMTADEVDLRVAAGMKLETGRTRTQVCFEGRNQKTNAWGKQYMYGGLQTNNDCQSTARELLRFAMGNVEGAGYPIVMHTHDDLVAEVEREFGSPEHFASLMRIVPPWLTGLPLMAKTWSGDRV